MKSKKRSLLMKGALQIFTYGEKGIETLITKAERFSEILSVKAVELRKKHQEKRRNEKQTLDAIQRREAEITTASYLSEKRGHSHRTVNRLTAIRQDPRINSMDYKHESHEK